MKKFKLFSMLAAISLVACVCLCSCGTDADEYSPERLSKENVYRYLAFNITVSDCIAEYKETNVLNKRVYDLSCVVTIATDRATDCYFKGAPAANSGGYLETSSPTIIEYSVPVLSQMIGERWQLPDAVFAQVGYDGTSAVSFSIRQNDVYELIFPSVATIQKTHFGVVLDTAKIVLSANGIAYHK